MPVFIDKKIRGDIDEFQIEKIRMHENSDVILGRGDVNEEIGVVSKKADIKITEISHHYLLCLY